MLFRSAQSKLGSAGMACAASGNAWDGHLSKMASFKELLHHTDQMIRDRWARPGENELGRLLQGFEPRGAKGKGALGWASKGDAPAGKMAACPCYAAGHRPEKKDEPWRARISACGSLLEYFGDATAMQARCIGALHSLRLALSIALVAPPACA